MIHSYLKTAIRNIFKHKIYSLINILGLAIGLAACILILLFVVNEFSFDRFHDNYKRIYRIAVDGRMSGDYFNVAVTPIPMGPAVVNDFPEIENAVRFQEVQGDIFISYDEKKFYENGLLFTDSTIFEVFTFDLVLGDKETLLDEPFSLVINESLAKKYFNNENPLGKVIRYNNTYNFKITGVIKDIPENSHIKFELLASWESIKEMQGDDYREGWSSLSIHTYILINGQADIQELDDKLDLYIMGHFAENAGITVEEIKEYNIEFIPYLQPLKDIHLHSNLMAELSPNSDISNVYLFGAIALFIILIACINFMNLSTARSTKRAREVGIRKVHGAVRKELIRQFLGESILMSLIALFIAGALVELVMPVYNSLIGQPLEMGMFDSWILIISYIVFAIIIGIIAGSYPAFFLSSFRPIKVIKGDLTGGSKKSALRNTLVVFQFAISIFLLIGTGIIYGQLKYVKAKKLGFDKEQVLVIPLRSEALQEKYEVFKNEFRSIPGVISIAASSTIPGQGMDGTAIFPEGQPETEPWLIFYMSADYDYPETMGMKMKYGRDFSKDFITDSSALIINETLVNKLGWGEAAIGKKFTPGDPNNENKFHVIGVVEDFHFESLYDKIEPMVISLNQDRYTILNLKIDPANMYKTVSLIEDRWNNIDANFPFDYMFINQTFDDLYRSEERTGKLFIYFSVIAIFIACLGLFGLSSFTAEQRTKEIGIRKTMGASVGSVVLMLSRQYTRWVLVANILAWPVAFYFLSKWLENFAYRIEVLGKWWIFPLAAIISLFIAILTVLYQSIKAASSNPVNSLKYE